MPTLEGEKMAGTLSALASIRKLPNTPQRVVAQLEAAEVRTVGDAAQYGADDLRNLGLSWSEAQLVQDSLVRVGQKSFEADGIYL